MQRFSWFILVGAGLVLFLLCSIALLGLPLLDAKPKIELTSTPELTSTATQTEKGILDSLPDPQDVSITTSQPSVTQVVPEEIELAYVTKVIDGDTIEVILNGETRQLRYIGVDSPEIGEVGSSEAMEENRILVEDQIISLEKDVSEVDQFGRLLRYVYLQDGTFVNAQLVELGCAAAVAYPPDTKYQQVLNLAQRDAKNNGCGLWPAPEAVHPTPVDNIVAQVILDPDCSRFNAPGNDNENKNEEYVCFLNPGLVAIDMSGWQLRDQYGWVYQFPEFTLNGNSMIRIRTGCGVDSAIDLFWCKSETAVWNNDGDCVYLENQAGEIQIEYCY